MKNKPTVYLLCGLPGSGKTTWAKDKESEECIRLSLDEFVLKKFGRNTDLKMSEREEIIKPELTVKVKDLLKENKSVILDWGFWQADERQLMAKQILNSGAQPILLFFDTSFATMLSRISRRDLNTNHFITAGMMKRFRNEFEPPTTNETFMVIET